MGGIMALPLHIIKKIDKNGPIPSTRPELGPRWVWRGYISPKGYGRTSIKGKSVRVHKAVFEALRGPIEEGLELDHLCRVNACCNPVHLEPVPHRVNVQRGDARTLKLLVTHCPAGHAYTEENTRKKILQSGGVNRVCRTCERQYKRSPEALRRARDRYAKKKRSTG
jgi:HNH endonuclease